VNTRAALLFMTLALAACGSDSPTGPQVRTETFSFSLVDPDRCTCGNGIAQYTIDVAAAGTLDATATWTPADANVIVRLLDSSFNTVFATSTATGATARLSHNVTPGTYRMQVFLSGTGARNASYQLSVSHP
jgi:hypothetical protein